VASEDQHSGNELREAHVRPEPAPGGEIDPVEHLAGLGGDRVVVSQGRERRQVFWAESALGAGFGSSEMGRMQYAASLFPEPLAGIGEGEAESNGLLGGCITRLPRSNALAPQ
jgi:hypothetical protein